MNEFKVIFVKYHRQLMKILWVISAYLLTRLDLSDYRRLEDEIVKLQNIYDGKEIEEQ